MVDIEKIAKHIAELEKYTQRLDELKSIKKKDFLTDILQQYLFSVKSFLKTHSA